MKQMIWSRPFIAEVIGAPGSLTGRWAGVKGLPPQVVRTIAGLASRRFNLEYISRADPTLVLRDGPLAICYRMRSGQVYSTDSIQQDPADLTLFAAGLLLSGKSAFPAAYAKLLQAIADKAAASDLNAKMAAAGQALMAGCKAVLTTDNPVPDVVWFYAVKTTDESVDEFSDKSGIKLAALFASPTEYAAYRAGKSAAFPAAVFRFVPR